MKNFTQLGMLNGTMSDRSSSDKQAIILPLKTEDTYRNLHKHTIEKAKHENWRWVAHLLEITTYYLGNISFLPKHWCESVLQRWIILLFALTHNQTEGFNSLCMGDVSPAGLDRFGRGSSLVLPRHEHVWGQLYVLVIFGQGEKGVAARVALRQGQSHVCVLCLRRTRHIYIYIPTHRYFNTLTPTEFQKTAYNYYSV